MKIKFTQNPTGKYNLSYSSGEVANIPDEQAKLLVQEGYATPFIEGETETTSVDTVAETASVGLHKKEKKVK